jgi:hypothetical protein
MRWVLWFTLAISLTACGGAAQKYGFSREYEPLSEEEDYFETAEQVSYEELRRDPAVYQDRIVAWFGVVTVIDIDEETNLARAALDLRFHQERHLCADQFESSCRVTVSERSGGPFTAIMTLREEDAWGKNRVYTGSLLKVYGTPRDEFDDQGGPILETKYYRHWPRAIYVTTASKNIMRR